jgi:hypothetical protein
MARNEKTEMENKEVQRIFEGDLKVYHDLFKLEVAGYRRNMSWREDVKEMVDVDHCHFYHTYDSSGRKQDSACSVLGHTHIVTIENVDGKFVANCSGPVKKVGGKIMKASVDCNHTHKISYIKSEIIKKRVIDPKALEIFNKATGPDFKTNGERFDD